MKRQKTPSAVRHPSKIIMPSSHLLPNPVRGVYQPLSSRASSATLFLSQHIPYSHTDVMTDPVDMSIAQGLLQTGKLSDARLKVKQNIDFRLGSPRITKRRSSFSHLAKAQQPRLPVDNDEQLAGAGPCHDRRSRQGISSNTWTSSSGKGSEDDGNDDRTQFMDEYNKLAKKVCLIIEVKLMDNQ